MGFYISRLGDAEIVLEAPATGAFAKGASDVDADPRTAVVNIIRTIRIVGEAMGRELVPACNSMGAAMDINFGVRADSYGVVMVSQNTSEGQFNVTIRIVPRPPAQRPPGPPGPPPPRPG